MAIGQEQLLPVSRLPQYGQRTALALTQGTKRLQPVTLDRKHVAFLRLVTPHLHRRHAGIIVGYPAQLETAATPAVIDQLGYGI